jgi:hypothetical protein
MRRWVVVGVCLLATGCARGPKLFEVSGSVRYDGQPLPAGVVYFDPDIAKGNDGPQGYAIIKDGSFTTSAPGGQGVVGGAYLVRIEGFDGQPGHELPLGKPLFTDFEELVDLPKAPSKCDFEVPKKR